MTARRPADFEVRPYGYPLGIARPDGAIEIQTREAAPEYDPEPLTPREARALAHWLTLAAEYAESLESPTDPVEELADAQLGLTGALK